MARPSLKRLLRGSSGSLVDDVVALIGAPIGIVDDRGAPIGAPAPSGERFAVRAAGQELGAVIGPPAAATVAALLAQLAEREAEKVALAEETLGRYKELTLLYDISERLAGILDVDEACRIVVEVAQGFLQAATASILMLDQRRGVLEPVASVGDASRVRTLAASAGVEGRVLVSRRAEFVEDAATTDASAGETGVAALMVAPLRSGDSVFGILRVTSTARATWTAGHLKFVTSLAGNAASAISHAMLHRERLRQQVLRHRIERFASPLLLDAALERTPPAPGRALAVVFCDAGEIARYAASDLAAEEVVTLVRRATTTALDALVRAGATAQISDDEIVVAVFSGADGVAAPARAAATAATQAVRRMERRFGGFVDRSPGFGVAHAEIPSSAEATHGLLTAVGAAATLQQRAHGRILVDEAVAAAVGVDGVSQTTGGTANDFEVRA